MGEDRDDVCEIKLKINNLLWMHASESLTIGEAEDRACAILNIVIGRPLAREEK